jgi:hypothetical protein
LTTATPPLSSRSRLVQFLATVGLIAAIAGVIWTVSAPPAAEVAAQPDASQPTAAESVATQPALRAVSGALPTPITTPRAGQGGQVEVLPTPTLLPQLIALIVTDQATAEVPTATAVPTEPPSTAVPPTETPPPSPTSGIEPPQRLPVNGIPYESIIVLPEPALQRAREIYAAGQAIGRNPRAYAKVGDSTTENPHFLARYDTGPYELGQFVSLQPVIDYFLGSHGRDSVAVHVGLHAWSANDPAWADKSVCPPNETPVQCEIRLQNPSILLIRLGTNDVGVPGVFDGNIRQIVETAIAGGVIPVIGTKGDRHEGSNENNDILRRVAADYQIPLWDFDRVADTLPGRGLDQDAAHMVTFYSHDFNDPTAFTRGHAMHNLTALMMLDAIWREVMAGGPR